MKGEAFASDDSTYLQLDYELVCRIMDGLEVGRQDEGRPNDGLRDRRIGREVLLELPIEGRNWWVKMSSEMLLFLLEKS